MRQNLNDKQDEIDMIKDQLLKKEGIEQRLDDYKAKLEFLKDSVDQKNSLMIQFKDKELQI